MTKEIYLLNGYPQKIIKYDLSGKLIDEINLPMRFSSFAILDEGSIVLLNEPNSRKYGNPRGHPNDIYSRLFIIAQDGRTFAKGGSVNSVYDENTISHTNFGLMKNKKVSYYPLFNDTIFELEDDEPYPSLVVDFGTHTLKKEKVAGLMTEDFFRVCKENDYYYIDGQHSQTPDFKILFLYSSGQHKSYYCILNKANGEYIIFHASQSNLYNPCNLLPLTSSNEFFVSITSIAELMEIKYALANLKRIETIKSSKFTPPQKLLDRIDENSNPVLAFYTLRPEKINPESVYLTKE